MSSNYQLDSAYQANYEEKQDHNIYLSTIYWPSNQRRQLPTRSWHAQKDKELLSDELGMDVDAYSDDSYDYSRSIPTNYEETLTQYPTDNTTLVDSSTNDQPTHVDGQSTLFSESITQAHEDDNYALLYPTPPSSTPVKYLDDNPRHEYESTTLQDANNVYYSTTHWPSNHFTLPYSKPPQLPPIRETAYERHNTYHKVNRLINHNSHDDNIHDKHVPPQPILHMPKPTYPMTFKSTSDPSQNGPRPGQNDNAIKLDYTTPPPLIRKQTRLFNPSALIMEVYYLISTHWKRIRSIIMMNWYQELRYLYQY
jgi:hypothetical protein